LVDPLSPRGRMTFAEAARLDPDEKPGELDAGRWVSVTKGTWRHGQILINIGAILRSYARANPGWSVSGADPGTKLGRDPDVLRGPDVAIVRLERVPTGKGEEGWLEGAPDVAVEVLGDAQSMGELTRKALDYLRAGAKQVWLADADSRSVVVYTSPDRARVVGPDEVLDGGDVLPGFSCRVSEFFE
jgi:Uma2 family endonuclease